MKNLFNSNNEIFTDNTKVENCKQCKNCIHWNKKDTPWANKHDKAYCEMFPYPDRKPIGVINNTENCEVRETED